MVKLSRIERSICPTGVKAIEKGDHEEDDSTIIGIFANDNRGIQNLLKLFGDQWKISNISFTFITTKIVTNKERNYLQQFFVIIKLMLRVIFSIKKIL